MRRLADGRDADKDVETGLQLGVRLAQGTQGGIDGGSLPLNLAQPLTGQPLEQERAVEVVAIGCGGAVLD